MINFNHPQMIVWLDRHPRCATRAEPLVRVGALRGKDYAISRTFDHLAFSYRPGPDLRLRVEDASGSGEIDNPHCMLSLPGETRTVTPLRPVDEFFLVFAADSVPALFNGLPPVLPPFNALPLRDFPLAAEYVRLMLELLRGDLTPQVCSQLDLLGWNLLACTFWRDAERIEKPHDRALAEIENRINRYYHTDLDLQELARRFGMSYPTLRRVWARKHALSPHATVLRLRNREAQELLRNHNLPIAKVAELVGFRDARYFSRFFHDCNGVTPTEFRRRNLTPERDRAPTGTDQILGMK